MILPCSAKVKMKAHAILFNWHSHRGVIIYRLMGQAMVGGEDGLLLGHPTSIGTRIFEADIFG